MIEIKLNKSRISCSEYCQRRELHENFYFQSLKSLFYMLYIAVLKKSTAIAKIEKCPLKSDSRITHKVFKFL